MREDVVDGLKTFTGIAGIALLVLLPAFGQNRAAPAPAEAKQVNLVQPVTGMRSTLGVSYPEGTTLSIKFQGTERLPRASGEAKVERKKGQTEVEIELDEMKPASSFGGQLSTYVLWTVSPEGLVANTGEFIVEGNRSKLNISTPLQTFGMFVTAEPHFLVDKPSRFVVLENSRLTRDVSGQMLKTSTIYYKGFDGMYPAERESLASMPETKGETRTDMKQARVAVDLAEKAGAAQYATEELSEAQKSLRQTIDQVEAKVSPRQVMVTAHETVRLAVDAERKAKERAFQAALDAERKEHANQIQDFKTSIATAQTEAERARLLAEQRKMELAMEEQARREATLQAQAEAEQRRKAEMKANLAEEQAMLAANAKQRAEQEAAAAKAQAEQARSRLRSALDRVVETRETARGLIVNLPDILFDFNKSSLRPEAREKLSKVCGILLVAQGYGLSIEGHTDSIGSDEYNQKLSRERAGSVEQYLATCGLSDGIMESKGLGESQPIASNDTNSGRQQNRRVEIVIEEGKSFSVGGE